MSDWGGIGTILTEARAIAEAERRREPADCPLCGTPLDTNPRDVKNCPMGHWRSSGGPR